MPQIMYLTYINARPSCSSRLKFATAGQIRHGSIDSHRPSYYVSSKVAAESAYSLRLFKMANSDNSSDSIWLYNPSLGAAILFTMLYAVTTLVHVGQLIRYKTMFCLTIVIVVKNLIRCYKSD
jgi:hypothetical protein